MKLVIVNTTSLGEAGFFSNSTLSCPEPLTRYLSLNQAEFCNENPRFRRFFAQFGLFVQQRVSLY